MDLDGARLHRSPVVLPSLPAELWGWLVDSSFVRADVVADVRARLAAGERPTAMEVADAVIQPPAVGTLVP